MLGPDPPGARESEKGKAVTGQSQDLLKRLQLALEAKDKHDAQQAQQSKSSLGQLLRGINKSLEEADARSTLKAKQEAKRAELREGGRQAHERDWVRSVCPTPVVPDVVKPTPKQQAPITPPKPVAERSTEELYALLLERWRRYVKVVTDSLPDRRQALDNAMAIAQLLEERGESSDDIVTFIQAETQEGGD